MFIRNCWYVVAWDHEIPDDGLFNRTVIGEPLLLYRTAAGAVVAMEDRCCHRQAPLSKGRKEGDCVRCGYHGMKFFDTFGHYGFLMKLRAETIRDTGACISPFNSFLLLQGIETLSLRMERHVANAQKVAEFLEGHKLVGKVHYAGLPSHRDYAMAQKYMPKGPGAVMSFEIAPKSGDARQAGKAFIENLHLFSHLANVGDAKSLVIHPGSTTHQQLSDDEMIASGITPGTVRLSVGLETTDDLLWDLDQALSAAESA